MPAAVDDAEPLERLTAVGRQDEATVEAKQPEASPAPGRNHDGHSATVRHQSVACRQEGVERMRARRVRRADVDDHRVASSVVSASSAQRGTNTTVSMPKGFPRSGSPKRTPICERLPGGWDRGSSRGTVPQRPRRAALARRAALMRSSAYWPRLPRKKYGAGAHLHQLEVEGLLVRRDVREDAPVLVLRVERRSRRSDTVVPTGASRVAVVARSA